MESHGTFVVAVHAVFAATAIVRPLAASLPRLVLVGFNVSVYGFPACTTWHICVIPPPATTTAPVRAKLPNGFSATSNTIVPFVVPECPDVMESHGTFVVAVHAVFAATAIVRPLAASLPRLVLAGSNVST